MKKTILSILLFTILLIGVTGCGKSKLIGRYEWRPYNDNEDIYAYYDFNKNGKCLFVAEMGGDYQGIPQTYTYIIKKEDSTNYTLILTNINKNEEITLSYNSKTDTLIDNFFKEIESNLGKYGTPSSNKIYGQFLKTNNNEEAINKTELNKLLNKLDNPNKEIMVEFKDGYNYKRVYYNEENNTINIIKSITKGEDNTYLELVIDIDEGLNKTYLKYFHLNVNNTEDYDAHMVIKFDIPFKNNKYNYDSNKAEVRIMTGYKEKDEIKLVEKGINDFFKDYDKVLKSSFNTSWKKIGFYN